MLFEQVSFLERKPENVKRFGHLIEGVKHWTNDERRNEIEQNKLMVLMDNVVRMGATKANCSIDEILNESYTLSTDSIPFVKNQLYMLRKTFPNMISREICSVQPISQPTTKVFYHDIVRGSDGSSLSQEIHDQRDYANNEEYNPSSPTDIADISMVITGSDVSAIEKKLKGHWTVESEQDIMNYHGIGVESEITDTLSAEIVREWDRTIIASMLNGATGGASTFDTSEPTGMTYQDRKFWMETLFESCIDVDTQIYKKRYKKTSWMIVPPEIAGFMEKVSGFKIDDSATVDQKVIVTGGRYFAGTMSNRWRVYVDPFFPSNKILMGYNGVSWLDTAFVFCPYILAFFSDTFMDPNTFTKVKAILSRAAQKVVVGDLLGVVTLSAS